MGNLLHIQKFKKFIAYLQKSYTILYICHKVFRIFKICIQITEILNVIVLTVRVVCHQEFWKKFFKNDFYQINMQIYAARCSKI